ncbi:Gfo/Idh/MocA family oxidoreductase [Antarctobacter jejuensis]|uniref:Gfo/Idh/MocA family oxidoreductase n=1 Tax=Antarctobacter jejuensis TaxID=1439938 RepID=UPI003FD63E9D
MTVPLPLCVIGAGSIGRRHIEVATLSPEIHLTAVVEPQAETRERLAQQGLPMVASLDEVPKETRACVIATPTPDHMPSTLAALSRGWAVLVEKPFADTLDNARTMMQAAETAGLPLIVGHHRRCHPYAMAMRDALPAIGPLVGLQGFWSVRKHDTYYDVPWRRLPGAGPLASNLSHEIDLLGFMTGIPTEVTALTSSATRGLVIEDTAALAFRFENGALGSFLMSDAGASPWSFEATSSENPEIAGSDQDYLRFTGPLGALAFPSLTRWGASGPGEVEWSKPLKCIPGPHFDKIDPIRAQIDRFAALLDGGTDDVLCRPENGFAALEMTLATALSGQTHRPVKRGEVPGDFTGVLT